MTAPPAIDLVLLNDLQPSQLYISQAKLSSVAQRLDAALPERIEPIPYKVLDGLKVMTDGHTRAFAAYLAGCAAVPAYKDPDDLDWEAYRICVEWCHAEGIHTISDLAGRVVSTAEYERLWYDRCRKMQADLAEQRSMRAS
ncbi:MAG: hypothetical protein ACNA70_08565 [Brevefilum sp.]